MTQLDIFDIIQDVTKQNHCQVCKQPCNASVCSDKCADILMLIVFGWLMTDEQIEEYKKKFNI